MLLFSPALELLRTDIKFKIDLGNHSFSTGARGREKAGKKGHAIKLMAVKLHFCILTS